jgi:hypothetical protein
LLLNSTDDLLQGTVPNQPRPAHLRQRCRNPQCRTKLPAPVGNSRGAFCSSGCHASFFRTRCRVCEESIEQPTRGGVRFTCNKAKCKRAWRAGFGPGRYPTLNHANSIQERPVNKGPKVGINDDRARPWLVVAAGDPLTANQYHCAIVGGDAATATARVTHSSNTSRNPIAAAAVSSWAPTTPSVPDPQDLSIPEFLRRASAASEAS